MRGIIFMLRTSIEYFNTQVIYECDCHKFKLRSAKKTVIGCNASKALVKMDSYNSLKANIHNDIVVTRGAFTLAINDKREDHWTI